MPYMPNIITMYSMGLQIFHAKGPHLLLWAASGTVSAVPNCLNYCEIFIVYKQFSNVVLGCIIQPGELHAAHWLLVGVPWSTAISYQPWLSVCIQFYQPRCLVLFIHIHFYFFGCHGKYGDFHIFWGQGCTDLQNKFPSFCNPTVVCVISCYFCVFIPILILKMLLLTVVLVFSEWTCYIDFVEC